MFTISIEHIISTRAQRKNKTVGGRNIIISYPRGKIIPRSHVSHDSLGHINVKIIASVNIRQDLLLSAHISSRTVIERRIES